MQNIENALILWFRDISFHTIFTCLFSIIVIQVKAIFIWIISTTLLVKISMPKLDRISVDVRARSQNLLNLIQLFGKLPKRYVTYNRIKDYSSLAKAANFIAFWELYEWQILVVTIIWNFQNNFMKLSRFWDRDCTSTLVLPNFGILIFTRSVVVKISMPKLDGISVDVCRLDLRICAISSSCSGKFVYTRISDLEIPS